MKTKVSKVPWWEDPNSCPPFIFNVTPGSKSFEGEVEKLTKRTLHFRTGNGKVLKIKLSGELKFPLPKDRRCMIYVTGKVGKYVLSPQIRRPPTPAQMGTKI